MSGVDPTDPAGAPTGLVLTGGASRRMGRDKATLTLEGRPLVLWAVEALRPACARVVAVDPHPGRLAHLDLEVIADAAIGSGPLAGLLGGLRSARTEAVFLVGCDMPHVRPELVALLARERGEHDAAVAIVDGRPQPLGAVYARRIADRVESWLASPGSTGGRGTPGLRDLLATLAVRAVPEEVVRGVDPELVSFHNLNTPADLAGSAPGP